MADQDKRELLRSMLNGLINDKPEEAGLDLHNYLTAKMRDLAGLSSEQPAEVTGAEGDEASQTPEVVAAPEDSSETN